jgi:hypothetical protein
MMTSPLVFKHAVELMDADDWLQTIERKFEIAHCEGRDKVLYASHNYRARRRTGGLLSLLLMRILNLSHGRSFVVAFVLIMF